jgi:hypothetical protein
MDVTLCYSFAVVLAGDAVSAARRQASRYATSQEQLRQFEKHELACELFLEPRTWAVGVAATVRAELDAGWLSAPITAPAQREVVL